MSIVFMLYLPLIAFGLIFVGCLFGVYKALRTRWIDWPLLLTCAGIGVLVALASFYVIASWATSLDGSH